VRADNSLGLTDHLTDGYRRFAPTACQPVLTFTGTGAHDQRNTQIQARAAPDGTLAMTGMSIPAFEMVRLPRVWDDPTRREKERGAGAQLDRLVRRFRSALDVWMGSVAELGRWNELAAGKARPRGRIRGVSPRSDDEPQQTH